MGSTPKTSITYPGPTPQETALMELQTKMMLESAAQQKELEPFLYQTAGLMRDPETSALRKMTAEESYAGMTPAEQEQYDISQIAAERTKAALEGTLPVPADVQEALDKQRRSQTQQLATQLGPGWETSSPGMEAEQLYAEQQAGILDAVRRGEMTGAQAVGTTAQSQLDQAMQNFIANSSSPIAGTQSVTAAMQIPISEYASERAALTQSREFNAAQKLEAQKAKMQGISSGASCCFIFLAADLGEELLDYVRRYKESHFGLGSDVAFGYKKLAIWIVPKMRRNERIKRFVKFVMAKPMSLYAKAYYEKDFLRQINLYPIALFWGIFFSMIGKLCGERGWTRYWRLVENW